MSNVARRAAFQCNALFHFKGQYVSATFNASPFVEVEILGVPADCRKKRSATVAANAVNPVWQFSEEFRWAAALGGDEPTRRRCRARLQADVRRVGFSAAHRSRRRR